MLWLAKILDTLYHKSRRVLPLKWACDWYDNILTRGIDEALAEMNDLAAYVFRCPVCEGLDYPGLNHNTDSPECILYTGGPHG